jgi:putative flippase GtrA
MALAINLARQRRYAMVGAACAVMNNILLIAGDTLGVHYMVSTVLAFSIVTPSAYLLHAAYTFGEARSWTALWRFSAGLAFGFPIFFLVMALLCSGLRLPMIMAAPLATLILFVWNYVSARWAIVARLSPRSS